MRVIVSIGNSMIIEISIYIFIKILKKNYN